MTRTLLDPDAPAGALERELGSSALEPSAELDARTRRLALCALRARHTAPRIGLWELGLGGALTVAYVVYLATQIVAIFSRSI